MATAIAAEASSERGVHFATLDDAWHVGLAELLDTELATLDWRLTRAPGAVCRFVVPGG